jgi:hypothetical protein
MNSLTLALDFPKYIQIFICHACHSELLNRFCELILTLTCYIIYKEKRMRSIPILLLYLSTITFGVLKAQQKLMKFGIVPNYLSSSDASTAQLSSLTVKDFSPLRYILIRPNITMTFAA